jgi:hypothetical protein
MTVSSELQSLIDAAQDFASSSFSSAINVIASAQNAAAGHVVLQDQNLAATTIPSGNIDTSGLPLFLHRFTKPAKPTSPTLRTWYEPQRPTFPTAPSVLDTSDLFNFDKPVWDIDEFDETAPDISVDVTLPTAPVPVWPDAPDPVTITVGAAPTVTIPDFTDELSVGDPGATPTDTFEATYDSVVQEMRDWIDSYVAGFYTTYAPSYHTALSTLEAKIANDIGGGGTAITDSIENQIFNRATDRAEFERNRLDDEAIRTSRMRGFAEMPGEVRAALRRNQAQAAQNVSQVAAETAIERAKIEQQHVQFVMTMSQQLRATMVQAALNYAQVLASVNGQAIQYSDHVAQNAFRIYEMALRRYEIAAQVYQIGAQVYEVKIKASFAELEAYKIEIEGKKLQAELADIDIRRYAAKISAEQAKITAYVEQVKGIVEAAALEKLKVDIFAEQVRAYSARIDGKRGEFQAYESAIRGDSARVNAYAQQVSAYGTEVEAAQAFVNAEKLYAETISSYNRDLLDEYRADLQSYGIDVDAEKAQFEGQAEVYRVALDKYRAKVGALIDEKKLYFEAARMEMDESVKQLDADIQVMVEQGKLLAESIRLNATTAMQGAEALGRIGEAAVTAQNTLVSLTEESVAS